MGCQSSRDAVVTPEQQLTPRRKPVSEFRRESQCTQITQGSGDTAMIPTFVSPAKPMAISDIKAVLEGISKDFEYYNSGAVVDGSGKTGTTMGSSQRTSKFGSMSDHNQSLFGSISECAEDGEDGHSLKVVDQRNRFVPIESIKESASEDSLASQQHSVIGSYSPGKMYSDHYVSQLVVQPDSWFPAPRPALKIDTGRRSQVERELPIFHF